MDGKVNLLELQHLKLLNIFGKLEVELKHLLLSFSYCYNYPSLCISKKKVSWKLWLLISEENLPLTSRNACLPLNCFASSKSLGSRRK